MTETSVLIFFLSIAFILAPLMTNSFFLKGSRAYSKAHGISLLVLLSGLLFDFRWVTVIWFLFCTFGLFLYLRQESRLLFSLKGVAACIPFVFSLISATWLIAGSNDLQLLGYNTSWSFYAALHGSILGWIFIGCLAHLAKRPNANKVYLLGCYLCLILFLAVAFGINGIPYIKRLGVIGLSILVPFSIGVFVFNLDREYRLSRIFAAVSFLSIILSMTIAMFNEFWPGFPKQIFGLPLMTLTHGALNTLVTIPCFYLAILLEKGNQFSQTPAAGS